MKVKKGRSQVFQIIVPHGERNWPSSSHDYRRPAIVLLWTIFDKIILISFQLRFCRPVCFYRMFSMFAKNGTIKVYLNASIRYDMF